MIDHPLPVPVIATAVEDNSTRRICLDIRRVVYFKEYEEDANLTAVCMDNGHFIVLKDSFAEFADKCETAALKRFELVRRGSNVSPHRIVMHNNPHQDEVTT